MLNLHFSSKQSKNIQKTQWNLFFCWNSLNNKRAGAGERRRVSLQSPSCLKAQHKKNSRLFFQFSIISPRNFATSCHKIGFRIYFRIPLHLNRFFYSRGHFLVSFLVYAVYYTWRDCFGTRHFFSFDLLITLWLLKHASDFWLKTIFSTDFSHFLRFFKRFLHFLRHINHKIFISHVKNA